MPCDHTCTKQITLFYTCVVDIPCIVAMTPLIGFKLMPCDHTYPKTNYSARTINHSTSFILYPGWLRWRWINLWPHRIVWMSIPLTNQYLSPSKLNTFIARADHYDHIKSFTDHDQYRCKIVTIVMIIIRVNIFFNWKLHDSACQWRLDYWKLATINLWRTATILDWFDKSYRYTGEQDNIYPQVTLDSDNLTNDINDDALVILAKQTTLTETQKSVLRKFIPKTRQLATYTSPTVPLDPFKPNLQSRKAVW